MFKSFFLAGYECATGYNSSGQWIDQIAATQHDVNADSDYARLKSIGIHAIREAVRWPLIDREGHYDFSSIDAFLAASAIHGIEVVWDLFHYGYPPDLDAFSVDFADRFAAYCRAAAEYICERATGTSYFTPVNEPSYFAYAGGERGLFAPHATGRGVDLKYAMVRAAIRGIDAIWAVCPEARIVNVDSLCRVVAPFDRPDMQPDVDYFNNVAVFESWDMLAGRLNPELGGSDAHLDIVGINYYWTNQWELGREGVPLALDDPRCRSIRALVHDVYDRYGHPILVTETSHVDDNRAPWLDALAADAARLLDDGVPLAGVCLYPILGMPEWHEQDVWTRMGLWDLMPGIGGLERIMHEPMLESLRKAQCLCETA